MKTKKAKRVKVEFREVPHIEIVAHYQCPSCKTFFEDHGLLKENVIRFLCKCGQELIIVRKEK